MKIRTLSVIFSATFTVAVLAPFTDANALPGAGTMAVVESAPSAGLPGTNAPASAAPIGSTESDWMSHEVATSTSHAESTPLANEVKAEESARMEETELIRNIVAERAEGRNVDRAERQQWLGSISLARGERRMAKNYFQKAEADLKAARTTSSNVDAYGLDLTPDASNLHPNNGALVSY